MTLGTAGPRVTIPQRFTRLGCNKEARLRRRGPSRNLDRRRFTLIRSDLIQNNSVRTATATALINVDGQDPRGEGALDPVRAAEGIGCSATGAPGRSST